MSAEPSALEQWEDIRQRLDRIAGLLGDIVSANDEGLSAEERRIARQTGGDDMPPAAPETLGSDLSRAERCLIQEVNFKAKRQPLAEFDVKLVVHDRTLESLSLALYGDYRQGFPGGREVAPEPAYYDLDSVVLSGRSGAVEIFDALGWQDIDALAALAMEVNGDE